MTPKYQINSLEEYQKQYKNSIENPNKFWDDIANEFYWKQHWEKTYESDFLNADTKWFLGGKLNITENCIDRHLRDKGDQAAIIFEPNNPEDPNQIITYKQLYQRVCEFSNVLTNKGVKKVIEYVYTWG